jgi:histidinol-phosphatase (PHP family)
MDLHCHSENSYDASHSVYAMCEAAIRSKIDVLAITDHYEISALEVNFAEWDAGLEKSLAETRSARERFKGRLVVLTGIEIGQPLEKLSKAEEIQGSHSFDIVLGSLHNAPGRLDMYFMPDHADQGFFDRELEAYFANLYELVRWGGFDCAAHITYPFRYIMERKVKDFSFRRWDDHVEAIVRVIAEKGLALEINTSGVEKTPSHTLPDVRWVKRFRELGGENITLGGDAHRPESVGRGIEEGVRIAAEAGFTRLCYYMERKPCYVSLSEF